MLNKLFSRLAKWTIALIFIAFGVVLILQNLSIITLEMSNVVWDSWPVIIVLIGLVSFSNYFIPYKSGSWKFGSFLIVYGVLLWAGNFDYIEFGIIDVWKLWPLILVYIGANILTGRKTVSIYVDSDDDEVDGDHHDFVKPNQTRSIQHMILMLSHQRKKSPKGSIITMYIKNKNILYRTLTSPVKIGK